jgi:hypothetical protein
MKVLTVFVTTEDDLASNEDVANELHSLVMHDEGAFSSILSVDGSTPTGVENDA